MFEQTFVDGPGKTNKGWTVLLSFRGAAGCHRDSDSDSADLHGHAAEARVDDVPDGAAASSAASASASGRQ